MGDILLSGLTQGLIWSLLALGVYISYRILDVADLTCEGCITFGASVAAMLIYKEINPLLAILLAFISGCIAGAVTGILHTKLEIPPILAGILTMISLYSVNIHIMSWATGTSGTANLSLLTFRNDTLFAKIASLFNLGKTPAALIAGAVICLAIMGLLYWFFGTEIGSSIRATGTNEKMCRAQGIDTDLTKIIGLALGNGLIAVSGALLCQYQGYSDVNMGVGAIVIGLASIIIGEAIFAKAKNFFVILTGVVVGSIIYRIVVALVIYSGMPSTDLKLMTAVVVIAAMMITSAINKLGKNKLRSYRVEAKCLLGGSIFDAKWGTALCACLVVECIAAALAITYIGIIALLIIIGPLSVGLASFFTSAYRENNTQITRIFKDLSDDFLQKMLLGIMYIIRIILWSILFIIPGIVKYYSYAMCFYIKKDNPDMKWRDCLKESINMMNGHKAELFFLDLSFIGRFILITLIPTLATSIGVMFLQLPSLVVYVSTILIYIIVSLWITPYIWASHVVFYEKNKRKEIAVNE